VNKTERQSKAAAETARARKAAIRKEIGDQLDALYRQKVSAVELLAPNWTEFLHITKGWTVQIQLKIIDCLVDELCGIEVKREG